jgi:hypothetical protein
MSAILRISGSEMSVADVAMRSKLNPYRNDEKGVGRAKEGALHYLMTEEADSWPKLCEAVLLFLTEHRSELESLISAKGVDHAIVDIAVDFPEDITAKYVRIDNRLLRALSELGLKLEISLYRTE